MKGNWRRALLTDSAKLAEWNQCLIKEGRHRNRMTPAELEERMAGFLGEEYRGIIYSVSDDDVAYALFRIEPEQIYLRQFFVVPEFRRRGVGTALMKKLRDEVWPDDVRLTVEVLSHDRSATAFWRAVGYSDYSLMLEIMPKAAAGTNEARVAE